MSTRKTVRNIIRRKIGDYYGFTADVSGTHAANATEVYFGNEVNEEMIRKGLVLHNTTQDLYFLIIGVVLGTSAGAYPRLTIRSNTATMADGDDLEVSQYWTNNMLNDAISEAFDFMWPRLAKRAVNGSIILSANISAYAISAQTGVERLEKVEFDVDGLGKFVPVGDWIETTTGYLHLNGVETLTAGRKLRITYRGRWTDPTGDTNDMSADGLPAYAEPIIINYACAHALEQRATRRTPYPELSMLPTDSPEDRQALLELAQYYHKRAEDMLDRFSNLPMPEQVQVFATGNRPAV